MSLACVPHAAPVRTLLVPGPGPFCEDYFTVSFYMPNEYQVQWLCNVPVM